MHAIDIECPARLHLGFIDPGGASGRRFGSLGLALDGLGTHLRVQRARSAREAWFAAGERAQAERERALDCLARLRRALDFKTPLAIELLDAIPPHAGLGSGTQLALALGYAVARLAGREAAPRRIAELTQRGARSGIGIGVFEQGGFVVDGGRAAQTTVPPIVARHPFPAAWRVLLVFDASHRGLSGEAEVNAFRALPPFPRLDQRKVQLCVEVVGQARDQALQPGAGTRQVALRLVQPCCAANDAEPGVGQPFTQGGQQPGGFLVLGRRHGLGEFRFQSTDFCLASGLALGIVLQLLLFGGCTVA